ncbi:MAG: hypothetical protein CMD46_05165 [Gammaproteobacteria bacterium]|nr:hypothetical protein [Gammaproteobacteria bacterium]|tara:strand:- start:2461 stop:2823 length:363 start_codon:yes stop_codon:yes gene_type:complete
MKYIIFINALFLLVGCNMNQNYDKSMLPDSEEEFTLESIYAETLTKNTIQCKQLPKSIYPPATVSDKGYTREVSDENDCMDIKMKQMDTKEIQRERKKEKEFKLDLDLNLKSDLENQDRE